MNSRSSFSSSFNDKKGNLVIHLIRVFYIHIFSTLVLNKMEFFL